MPYATECEIQSGSDRQLWAEHLILQLPKDHDGRNSWLMNFGREDEAVRLRAERELPFYAASQAAMPPAERSRRQECERYEKCETGVCECHCLTPAVGDEAKKSEGGERLCSVCDAVIGAKSSSCHVCGIEQPSDPTVDPREIVTQAADRIVSEMHSLVKTSWDRECLRNKIIREFAALDGGADA